MMLFVITVGASGRWGLHAGCRRAWPRQSGNLPCPGQLAGHQQSSWRVKQGLYMQPQCYITLADACLCKSCM